jgi:hypothetical protein
MRCALSDSENERKRELECLRLASDLINLANGTSNPDLKAHCLQMAKVWTDKHKMASLGKFLT